ncbi:PAS domain S-box protein [Maribellus comscasis]|uniref:histidine kinase n=1 Tax=Maribellus comscasis TaxID=2681766 RepID=A0A6I6K2D7_9BACT|nr:PAS domain S-box protein [Maribellus comscasis]QGY45683.1 PAS domain S-box protein [Maribellus comscasis]
MNSEINLLKRRLEREQKARIEAEKLLEAKSLELYHSNQELISLNKNLEHQVKQRTEKLLEAEKDYEFLVESINDMIFRLDLKGNIIFANMVVTQKLGIKRSEVVGQNIYDLLPDEFKNKIKTHFTREFLKRNCISYYEFPVINKYNKTIWMGLNVHFSSEDCKSCFQKQLSLENFAQSMKAEKQCTFSEVIVVAHDITSQKYAQINLEKSEKRYRELSEFLPEMICEVNSKGLLTYANQYAIDKFGYSKEEVLKNNFSIIDIFPRQEQELVRQDIRKVYENGETISNEYNAVKKSGEIFPVLTYISPIYEQENTIGVRGVMLDITERKLFEQEIAHNLKQQEILSRISLNYNSFEDFDKKTNETLRIIGQHVNVSRAYIFENSAEGKTTSNTFEWCAEGIKPQIKELQNVPFSVIPSWKDRLEKDKIIFSENIKELPRDIYDILAPQDIKSIVAFPLIASHKIFGFIGFDECNSQRKWTKSEIELLKTISNIISNAFHRNKINSELIKSESENRIIINSIPDVIIQIDKNGNIKSFKSSQKFHLFAKLNDSSNDLVNNVFNEKIAQAFQKAIKECLLNGAYQFDFQDPRVNFIEFYEARMVKLNSHEVLVIIRNVTESRENEKQLMIAKTKAVQASKSKSEFLANVSHEIRTPLNAILGFSQWLFEDTKIEQHKEYLSTILTSGKNLLNLINDILDLSKIESGKMDIELQPMNYHEIINDIKMVFHQKVEQKGLSFKISTDASVPEFIYMDELRFYQIIFNLISNAIKFTSKGFVHVSAFAMRTSAKDEVNLNIVIEDTGIGIEEDQQKNIFDSFTQQSGQNNRDFEGTGLGLAIVSGLLKKLNGTISLKSAPKKGTVFTLTFNSVKIDNSEHDESENVEYKPNATLDPCKIMIVDDINYNIVVLKKLINSKNATYIEAQNGAEALAKLNNEKPDIIFMDIRMPGMSGYDVTEVIKNDEKLLKIPVIAFTASTIKQKNDRIDQLFDGYLQKPVFKKEVDSILFKHLSYSNTVPILPEKSNEDEIKEPLTDFEKALPEVILEIENNHFPFWQNIKDNLIIYEIEEFNRKLSEMAFQKSCKPVSKYCDELNIGLQTFDIEIIKKKLDEFPQLIKKLKTLTK